MRKHVQPSSLMPIVVLLIVTAIVVVLFLNANGSL
jgi:hypothetical protein